MKKEFRGLEEKWPGYWRMGLHILTAALVMALATPINAQTAAPTGTEAPTAAAEDVATVDGLIAALYDVISGPAGQARDWDRFRSLFVPEARLIPTEFRDGDATASLWTPEDYVARAGSSLEERGFFEIEIGRIEERFENIAHLFSTYESRRTADGDVFQRGINSIQIVWDGERWWIMNIMWRGVAPDAEIPARYLGGRR